MEFGPSTHRLLENSQGPILIENKDLLLQEINTHIVVQLPYEEVHMSYGLPPRELAFPVAGAMTSTTLACDNLEVHSTTPVSAETTQTASCSRVTESQQCHKWDESQTKFLLNSYKQLQNGVESTKRFRSKKLFWTQLATQLEEKFQVKLKPEQVESRYKCMTMKVVLNNSTSGAVREETPQEDDMYDIVQDDDSLGVDIRMSPAQTIRIANAFPERSLSSSPDSDITSTLSTDSFDSDPDDGTNLSCGSHCRNRSTMQKLMFEKFLAQKQHHFEQNEKRKRKRDDMVNEILNKILERTRQKNNE